MNQTNLNIAYLTKPQQKEVQKALLVAREAHKGQKRASGTNYINHPIAVTEILADMQLDKETLIAGLLHDVVEDAEISSEQLKEQFGEEVAFLVSSLTKISEYKFNDTENLQAENIRKMLLAMAKDIRVIIIKVADRLHNMRTLNHLSIEKQQRIAKETLEIYTPLAHRLGMGLVKWELEDLCFRYLEPERFQELKQKVALKRDARETYTKMFVTKLQTLLEEIGIKSEITGRAKHFYSIHNKMKSQGLTFDDIYDLIAVRIVTDNKEQCYSILGLIHSHWKPIQGKIKDYIAMPKANMYQSLHTTIVGPQGRPIEVQIRTKEMHEISESGVAAHWLYKTIDKSRQGKQQLSPKEKEYMEKLAWMRQLMKLQANEDPNAKDFMKEFKTDILSDDIFVFSPKGDVYPLPEDSTPVDFAYTIHSAIGNTCIGAKVNGRIVSLTYALQNGDIVEIMRGKEENPNPDWLKSVKTNHTKNKIKNFVNKLQKEGKIKDGQELLQKELKEIGITKTEQRRSLPNILDHYNMSETDLFYAIGKYDISLNTIIDMFVAEKHHDDDKQTDEQTFLKQKSKSKQKNKEIGVTIEGDLTNIMSSIAKCCSPVYGDKIIGVLSRTKGVSIHRQNCSNIKGLKERLVKVAWQNKSGTEIYLARLIILGYDRVGWFKDVLNLIAEKKLNVTEAYASHRGTITKAQISLEIKDHHQLEEIMGLIRQKKDIYEVYRS